MKVETGPIEGMRLIHPRVFEDARGSFFETFHPNRYREAGLSLPFVQDNRSISGRSVLRGLHYQVLRPQGHLITLTRGSVFDVGVDLRPDSPTFGQSVSAILSADQPCQLYLPPGVAHGFCVLSDHAEIWYKCTDLYQPGDEGGLLWSDPDIGISWPISNPVISPRDAAYPRLRDIPTDRLPQIRQACGDTSR